MLFTYCSNCQIVVVTLSAFEDFDNEEIVRCTFKRLIRILNDILANLAQHGYMSQIPRTLTCKAHSG